MCGFYLGLWSLVVSMQMNSDAKSSRRKNSSSLIRVGSTTHHSPVDWKQPQICGFCHHEIGKNRNPPKDEAKFWSRWRDHLRKNCSQFEEWRTTLVHQPALLQFWILGFVERPNGLADFAYWAFLQPSADKKNGNRTMEYPAKVAQWIEKACAILQHLDIQEHGGIPWWSSGHPCTRTAVLLQLYPDLFLNDGRVSITLGERKPMVQKNRRKDTVIRTMRQWRQPSTLSDTELFIEKTILRTASAWTCKTDRKWSKRIVRQEESWASQFRKCLPQMADYLWSTNIIDPPSTMTTTEYDHNNCVSLMDVSTGKLSISRSPSDEIILRQQLISEEKNQVVSIVPVRPLATTYHSRLSIELLMQSTVDEVSNDSLWKRLWHSFQWCCQRFEAEPVLHMTSDCQRYRLFQAKRRGHNEGWSVSEQYEFLLHWKLVEPKVAKLFARVPYLFSPIGGLCPFCWKLEPKDERHDGICRVKQVMLSPSSSSSSSSTPPISNSDTLIRVLIEDWFRCLSSIEKSKVKSKADEKSLRESFLQFCRQELLSKNRIGPLEATHIHILPATYALDVNLDRTSQVPLVISPWILFALVEVETCIRWFVVLDQVHGTLTLLDSFLSPYNRAFVNPTHFIQLFGQKSHDDPT